MFVPQRGPRSKDTGLRTPRLYSEPYAQHLVQQTSQGCELAGALHS